MDNPFNHSQEYQNYLLSLPKELYIKILENLFLGIFVSDVNGRTIYVNPAISRHYGKLPEELVNYNDWGKWEGIIYPPAYKQILIDKKPLVYRQKNNLSRNYMVTITNPVMKEANKDEIDFTVHVIQENFTNFDADAKDMPTQKIAKANQRRKIIGDSHIFLKRIVELEKVAKSDMAILLLGESGTGKTLIAEYIHNTSARKNEAFMSINCGAIPDNLLESELFGYVPGAFSGASKFGKKGLFEHAHKGTIFLDEIGDLPLNLQVKLLHVLESNEFLPVGGTTPIHVDVRIVSATNKNINEQIQDKKFREDLYWRINSFTSYIPALRERKEDIILLALHYLKKYNLKNNTNKVFYPLTLLALMRYDWPGNVRELRNIVERMYVLTAGNIIYETKLPDELRHENEIQKETYFSSYDKLLDQFKFHLINDAYNRHHTSTGVAKELGISQPKAHRLIKQYCEMITVD
ncbi:sigma-54 interaction domain-containing protein [Acetobacterium malicum]|uniref:sigma-54 interaction domain-containing protein n=1 Tax=Acetobacterium malicum TaxID=52692 RepID=UPI00040866AF|nr:sigma 54-interacting transcriptional regulator [Acetobacterium dehalogenans]